MSETLSAAQREAGAKVLRALAHPLRLGVLQCLQDSERTVTELYEALGCSQSMMSQQLGILETHGLIRTHKVGTVKYCALRNRDFLHVFGCLQRHLLTVMRFVEDDPATAAGRS